jgi:hypothetical protein
MRKQLAIQHKKLRYSAKPRINSLTISLPLTLLLAGLSAPPAQAHIIPVKFGSFDGAVAATAAGSGTGVNNGTSGNFGWIDGADGDWGDSHKIATYTFELTGQAADVALKFQRKTNAFGGTGLIPGFTLYQGVPHEGSDHDYSVGSELLRTTDCAATPGCTKTEGSLRSLTSFRITDDADPTGTNASVFTYIGSAYDGTATIPGANSPLYDNNAYLVPGGDGVADGVVSLLFQNLAPGKYIAFVGGADYSNQINQAARGIGGFLTITPTAVPVPAAVWFFGSALAGMMGVRRRFTETA